MGVIYVVNLAVVEEKRLAVKRLKQCVFHSLFCLANRLHVKSWFLGVPLIRVAFLEFVNFTGTLCGRP